MQTIKTLYKRWSSIALISLLSAAAVPAQADDLPQAPSVRQNQYPVALVHGFFGWGRNEMLGWKHFGGFTDLQEELKRAGYHTVTPAVGPISSNWDRACELYTQLVGGTVDYGAAHAAAHGHSRYGRTYSALLPGLGQLDASGQLQKVNIIAHSQGVPTTRLLIELLAHGSAAERAASGSGVSPLFAGTGEQFVHALGALSGANDGSLLAHTVYHNIDFENELIGAVTSLVNTLGADAIYDFKLDQFGVEPRRSNESFKQYSDRVMRIMIDHHNKDTAFWDLSADGAQQVNQIASAEPDVYYFSWSNYTTNRGWLTGLEYPDFKTNFLLSAPTLFMGTYFYQFAPGNVPINSSWWKNDGITSTRSMSAPINGSRDQRVNYNGSPVQPGVWNHMAEMGGWDHWDIIGLLDLNHSAGRDLIPLYKNVAQFLASTPAQN